jgi:hypothetical protein
VNEENDALKKELFNLRERITQANRRREELAELQTQASKNLEEKISWKTAVDVERKADALRVIQERDLARSQMEEEIGDLKNMIFAQEEKLEEARKTAIGVCKEIEDEYKIKESNLKLKLRDMKKDIAQKRAVLNDLRKDAAAMKAIKPAADARRVGSTTPAGEYGDAFAKPKEVKGRKRGPASKKKK